MFDLAGKAILRWLRPGSGRARRPIQPRSRPTLEMLETRLVPADVTPGPIVGAPIPPVANEDFLYYNIDTSSTLNVFQNDQVQNPGASLVLSSITIVSPPSYGILTLNPITGILLYTPNYLLPPGLPPGQQPPSPQQESFTYTIRDSLGATSNVATVLVSGTAPVIIGPIVPGEDFAQTATAASVAINVGANDEVRDGSAVDPASVALDTAPEHGTVTVNPTTGVMTYTPYFGFVGFDFFQYRISTTAGNGPGYGGVYVAVSPGKPRLQADPLGGQMLVVDGSFNNDTITVERGRKAKDVVVWINGVKSGTFQPTSRIVVFGFTGDDAIRVSKHVKMTAWVYGGEGNDVLEGGGGANVLLGGAGSDVLVGGDRRDLLIGGLGADVLIGRVADDILVSGTTSFDNSQAALNAVFLEWTSAHSYKQRVQNLTAQANRTFNQRYNGTYYLTLATVQDDGASDVVFGGPGKNLSFAAGVGDTVIARRKREVLFVL